MTILIQQSTSSVQRGIKLMPSQQQQAASLVCTGATMPNIVYHHHLHHHIAPNISPIIHQQTPSAAGSCYISYSYAPSSNLLLNSVFNEQSFLWNNTSMTTAMPVIQSQPTIATAATTHNSRAPLYLLDSVKLNKSKYLTDNSIESKTNSACSSTSGGSSAASTSSYYASQSCNSSNDSCSPPVVSTPNSFTTCSSPLSIKCKTSDCYRPTMAINEPSIPVASLLSPPFGTFNSIPYTAGGGVPFPPYSVPNMLSQMQEAFCQTANQPNSIMPLREYYARLGVYYTPVPWNQSYGMERVWMSEFRRIFSSFYNELWSIQPVEKKPNGFKLHMFVDSAKVRFCCDRCGHSWTSMKGRIVFWFNLLQPNFDVGIVTIKLFGQKCEMCKQDLYEQPMWYPEEVTKVLMNLYNRVGQIFYGFEKTKFEKQRRLGKPRTPHNKFLCQACLEGICLSRRRACQQDSTETEIEQNNEDCGSEQSSSDLSQHNAEHDKTGNDEDEDHYSEDSGILEGEIRNNNIETDLHDEKIGFPNKTKPTDHFDSEKPNSEATL